MTELERRALLGDKRAQEEATRQGIALPCVHGAECRVFDMKVDSKTAYRVISMNCCCCFQGPMYFAEKEALSHWNTRPAPPIGKCLECENACDIGNDILRCDIFDRDMVPDDYCSCFEPKGRE